MKLDQQEVKDCIGKCVRFHYPRLTKGNPVIGTVVKIYDHWLELKLHKKVVGMATLSEVLKGGSNESV